MVPDALPVNVIGYLMYEEIGGDAVGDRITEFRLISQQENNEVQGKEEQKNKKSRPPVRIVSEHKFSLVSFDLMPCFLRSVLRKKVLYGVRGHEAQARVRKVIVVVVHVFVRIGRDEFDG